jgi:predicted outer membrane repeat protein
LTVNRTTLEGNLALALPGAGPGDGAGVFATGALRIEGSTFDDNRADGDGGAICTGSGSAPNPLRVVINSTLSGNSAQAGGALSHGDGELLIKNSTIVGNRAPTAPALISHSTFPNLPPGALDYPRLRVNHLIVTHLSSARAGPLCKDEHFEATGSAAAGIIGSGFNLRGDDSCRFLAATDILAADPGPGPLAANGGRTLTHFPLVSSPAVNRGATTTSTLDADVACAPADQRGVSRPQPLPGQPTRCDIGAVEVDVH